MKIIVAPLVLTILQNICSTFGANILVFMPLPFPSHIRSYKPLFKELASTGHNVTFYTGSPFDEQLPNMKQIVIEDMTRHMEEFLQTSLKEDKNAITGWRHINFLWKRAIFACEKLFENPRIQELIRSKDISYDVILLETFFSHEPFVALSHKFNAPIINLHPIKAEEWISDVLKNPQPLSYVPNIRLPATDRMNFNERIQNVMLSLIQTLTGHFYYIPEQEKLMRKYFKYPGSETLPSLLSLLKNTSLTFLDGNSIISSTSPQLPNFISVGGIHISDNKKLSDDLEKWINDSPHGVIYLSFGSHIKISDLEPEKLNVFLKVLGNLPQRILWKWEKDGNIPGQPPNVKTSKWFPQLDILVHPKCLAFITHGGFHSVFEAAYFGVPIVGIPIFFDQESNLIMAENKGFAQMIKLPNLSVDTLSTALNNVLNNKSYKENAEYISKLIKDVPFTPLQTAVYWVDYIIRHKGAPHLKPYGAYLPWYQYYLVDIIATAIIITTFLILIIYKSFKIILRFSSNIGTKKNKTE